MKQQAQFINFQDRNRRRKRGQIQHKHSDPRDPQREEPLD